MLGRPENGEIRAKRGQYAGARFEGIKPNAKTRYWRIRSRHDLCSWRVDWEKGKRRDNSGRWGVKAAEQCFYKQNWQYASLSYNSIVVIQGTILKKTKQNNRFVLAKSGSYASLSAYIYVFLLTAQLPYFISVGPIWPAILFYVKRGRLENN